MQKVPVPSDNMLTYPPCPPPGEGARCVSSGRCAESSLAKATRKSSKRESGFALGHAEAKAACLPVFISMFCPSLARRGSAGPSPPPAPPSGAAKGRCSCTGNTFALEWPREGQFIKADFIMKGTGEAGGTGSLIYCTRGFSGPLIALQSLCVKCAARFSSFRSVLRFLFLPSSNVAV